MPCGRSPAGAPGRNLQPRRPAGSTPSRSHPQPHWHTQHDALPGNLQPRREGRATDRTLVHVQELHDAPLAPLTTF
ncbi:hypothetical protein ACWCQL_03515, partial [Streptomyces sp. NPDC002073]